MTGRDDRGVRVRSRPLVPGSPFVAISRVAANAAFTADGFTPGDYYVAAIGNGRFIDVKGEIENAELLESLVANATRVTLAAGQRATVALTVAR
jgi:hypothetical protein